MTRFLLTLTLVVAFPSAGQDVESDAFDVPHRTSAPPLATMQSIPEAGDLLSVAATSPDGGWQVKGEALTIDVGLQRALTDLLKTYQTPWAAVVAIEPATGRVLAMAEHAEADPSLRGLCTRAVYPAASIFKVVTANALLDAEVEPAERCCFHGGKRQITESLLQDSASDGRCVSFSEALGLSANVVFAKLTARYLDPERLQRSARALHFNTPWVFPVPTDPSLAAIPSETLDLASTGAGFGDVYLSPLHGAAMMGALANGGRWQWPVLFEREVGQRPPERAVPEARAATLIDMLENTVKAGTARRVFSERGHRFDAVGKTGSLADKGHVFRDYSWFVGFAPREHPTIAVAAVVVNDAFWRIRGTWLGAEAMRLYLEKHAPAGLAAAVHASPDAGVTPTPPTSAPRSDRSR